MQTVPPDSSTMAIAWLNKSDGRVPEQTGSQAVPGDLLPHARKLVMKSFVQVLVSASSGPCRPAVLGTFSTALHLLPLTGLGRGQALTANGSSNSKSVELLILKASERTHIYP